LPVRGAAQLEAPSPVRRETGFGPTLVGALRGTRSTIGHIPVAAGPRRYSRLGLARGSQPSGWPIPGPTSENPLPYDCGASAPGSSLRGTAGSPTPEPTTSPVSPDAVGAPRGTVPDRLQRFSPENPHATFGLHRVRPRASFRFDPGNSRLHRFTDRG
jgi:hypothetical protein